MFSKLKEALIGSKSKATVAPSTEETKQTRYTARDGELTQTDEAFAAWNTRDLGKMRAALETKTNLVDRHFLLMTIVDETYKLRKEDQGAKDLCAEIAEQHIKELPAIKPALMRSLNGILPRVTTFQKYATFLAEQGAYRRAIEVCEVALAHGLHDGTKGGFEARIEKIKKKAGIGDA